MVCKACPNLRKPILFPTCHKGMQIAAAAAAVVPLDFGGGSSSAVGGSLLGVQVPVSGCCRPRTEAPKISSETAEWHNGPLNNPLGAAAQMMLASMSVSDEITNFQHVDDLTHEFPAAFIGSSNHHDAIGGLQLQQQHINTLSYSPGNHAPFGANQRRPLPAPFEPPLLMGVAAPVIDDSNNQCGPASPNIAPKTVCSSPDPRLPLLPQIA